MITLKRINNDDILLLDNLLQLYLHDISLFFPIDFDSKTCKYIYDDLNKYINSDNNYAFLFINDGNIIGFSLIDKVDNDMVVQEMFILNNYKCKGFGEECIIKIFDKFKGSWLIKSLPCSPKSENFWEKTIFNYTNNKFTMEHIGKYNRAVFRFNNE